MWWAIAAIAANAVGWLAELFKDRPVAEFISEEEYQKAKSAHILANQRGDWKAGRELEPAMQKWEQKKQAEAFRQEEIQRGLGRLTEEEARGVGEIRRGLYAKGLRGAGEVYLPIEELRERVAEHRTAILRGEKQRVVMEKLETQRQKTLQEMELGNIGIGLWGKGLGLGLDVAGMWAPGQPFGPETETEKLMKEMTKSYRTQVTPDYMKAPKIDLGERYQNWQGPQWRRKYELGL